MEIPPSISVALMNTGYVVQIRCNTYVCKKKETVRQIVGYAIDHNCQEVFAFGKEISDLIRQYEGPAS